MEAQLALMDDREPHLPVGKLRGELLGRLLAEYATTDPDVIVGPGTGGDAAAIAVGGSTIVVKSDPITFTSQDPERYLVDVNANDLACLGARPRWLMVTALLAEGATTAAQVEAHFRELRDLCRERAISLVGGHTEITVGLDRPILVGVLIGEVAGGRLLKPGGARPGDDLLLTKALAIEGTALLAREFAAPRQAGLGARLLERAAHLLVDPGISIVPEAMALLDAGGVNALHDPTEGGLATGVRELALAAGCGATIERAAIPILPETEALAQAFDLDPLGMLASGSLLVAADPNATARLKSVAAANGVEVTRIGSVTAEAGVFRLRERSHEEALPAFESDEIARVLREVRTAGAGAGPAGL
jgi:hydrogenase expression/formation protein HypE